MSHQKKEGKNINCLVNYEGFSIKENLLDEYAKMCCYIVEKYYKSVIRYSVNGFSHWEGFDEALRKNNVENTDIFDVYLDGYVVKGRQNIRNCELTLANTEVKLGIDIKTGKKVAIKIFNKKTYDLEQLKQEIEIHKKTKT